MKNKKLPHFLKSTDDLYRFAEHFLAFKRSPKKQSQMDAKVLSELRLSGTGKVLEVETFSIDQIDKFDKAMKELKPIILKGAASDWECLTKWRPEYLKERYGKTQIPLLNPDMKDQASLKAQEESTTLDVIIDCLLNDDQSKYARFSNLMHIHPELKDDIDTEWFLKRRSKFSLGSYYSLFLGAKGTKTNLHAACSHNLFCQVMGKKDWTIISPKFDPALKPVVSRTPYFMSTLDPHDPDKENFPAFEYVDQYKCILEPGDILFNPSSWWHKVINLEASIGFGFRWFHPLEVPKISPIQTLQFIGATNPTLWSYIFEGKSFSKVISKTR